MRLISLVLKNYRKFKHSTIMFADGVIGLLGVNGAGKSSILEAIGWVIFGNVAARTTKDLIKRDGAGVDEECRVELQFEIGENKYTVMRQFGGKTHQSEAQVTVNGTVMASSSTEATQYLETVLGMDYTSFFTSLIAKQKELNALSDKTPGERKKIVMRMLNIDTVDIAIRHVRQDRRDMENRIQGIQVGLKDINELKQSLEKFTTQEKNLSEELSHLDEEQELLKKKVDELKALKDDQQKKFEDYSTLYTKYERFLEGLTQKKEYLETKKSEKKKIQDKQDKLCKMKPLVAEYEDIVLKKKSLDSQRDKYLMKKKIGEEITSLADEMQKMASKQKAVEDRLSAVKGGTEKLKYVQVQKEKIEKKKRELDKRIHQKQSQIEVLETHLEEIETDKKKIQELGPKSNCPMCKRPLGDHYRSLITDLGEKIDSDSTKLAALRKEIKTDMSVQEQDEQSLNQLSEKEQAVENLMIEEVKIQEELKHLREDKTRKEEKLGDLKQSFAEMKDISFEKEIYTHICNREQELRKVKDTYLGLESDVKRLPAVQKDIHQLHHDILSVQKNLDATRVEIEKLGFKKEKYEIVNKKYEERREALSEKEKKRVHVAGDLKQCSHERKRIKEDIEEQDNQRKQIKEIRRSIMDLETLAGERDTGLLTDFKRYLISRISPLLSHYGSQLFTIFTKGKYNTIEIDEDYEIFIYDKGERLPLNRFSGGESDLANLCLRLAISQVVAKRAGHGGFRFIALDEIFGSQDTERKANVLNALHELSNQFRQILLVTHIEDIKDSMEHVIQVQEGEDGISYVEIV